MELAVCFMQSQWSFTITY